MIDHAKLGGFVQETMEQLDEDFGPEAELGDFLLVTEIRRPATEEDTNRAPEEGQMVSDYMYHSSEPRGHVQIGLLRSALIAAEERE